MQLVSRLHEFVRQHDGVAILRSDVAQFGSGEDLTLAFQQLESQGVLLRLGAGVYAKAKRVAGSDRLTIDGDAESLAREVFARLGRVPRPALARSESLVNEDSGHRKRAQRSGGWMYMNDRVKGRAQAVIDLSSPAPRKVPTDGVSGYVAELARRLGVRYSRSFADGWAEDATRMAGDEIHSDHTGDLLVALRRARKLSDREMSSLLLSHLRERKRVRSLSRL